MPKSITQYRVFIGSPGGLQGERKRFRELLDRCSLHHGLPKLVMFHPVGWEDTVGGVGRAQDIINQDLEQCDYAVFILHDRWGMPTGSGFSSGTEEEFTLAERLYTEGRIRNIALLFKDVDQALLNRPDDQLKQVLAFKRRVEDDRRHFYKTFATLDQFADLMDGYLGRWLETHSRPQTELAGTGASATPVPPVSPAVKAPSFDVWIAEATRAAGGRPPDWEAVGVCASRAVECARTDAEWANATSLVGKSHFFKDRLAESLKAFESIYQRMQTSNAKDAATWLAQGLVGKGATLGKLGRDEDALVVFDEAISRYGGAPEAELREKVARTLVNKGVLLSELGRVVEAIAAYDEVLRRFKDSPEEAIRVQIAIALVGKGWALGEIGRHGDSVAALDEVIRSFGNATEPELQDNVAISFVNKGVSLWQLGRTAESIATYDEVVRRYSDVEDMEQRQQVAKALFLKAITLRQLDRKAEAVPLLDSLITEFQAATNPQIVALVQQAVGIKLLEAPEPKPRRKSPKKKP